MSMTMTRLTKDARQTLHRQIMHGIPDIDYLTQIRQIGQEEIIRFAPKSVQTVYANEGTRRHLMAHLFNLKRGNASILWHRCYGLTDDLTLRMDEGVMAYLKEGTVHHAIAIRILKDDLLNKYLEQEALRESVSKRLKANLEAANTIKQLYETLEPELHRFIPREPEAVKKVNLPTAIAPVVEDLKKLGFGAK
jgi:hypothetical protein